MYESEKALARLDFIGRFEWNDASGALLRSRVSETRNCVFCVTATPPVERKEAHRMYDYEDEQSGGFPLCDEHASEVVHESMPIQEAWVTQDPAGAWTGVGQAEGSGWSGLWFLFAAEGKYAKDDVWPYEEAGR